MQAHDSREGAREGPWRQRHRSQQRGLHSSIIQQTEFSSNREGEKDYRVESPMDRGAWWAAVHGVAKSRTRLSDFTYSLHFCVNISRSSTVVASFHRNPEEGSSQMGDKGCVLQ